MMYYENTQFPAQISVALGLEIYIHVPQQLTTDFHRINTKQLIHIFQ